MVKYKVSFKFDLDEALGQIDRDHNVDVEELDDGCFYNLFNTTEKIKTFEEWYNNSCDSDEDKIIVKDIIYDGDWEDAADVLIYLEDELPANQLDDFKDSIMEYLFEDDRPILYVHEYGVDWRPCWDGYRQEPSEERYEYDNYESYSIDSYYDDDIETL